MRIWGRILLLAGLASGCSVFGPPEDSTRWVVLASVDELEGQPTPAPAAHPLRLGLGPIQLPDYLRRTALVTRVKGTRIEESPAEKWAEPFERSLERVLATDLQRALGTDAPRLHPWYETDRPDVQVELSFARCERVAGGGVVVAAGWIVRRLDVEAPVIAREVRLEHPVAGEDGAAVARALSETLVELCAQIADAVRASTPGPAAARAP